MRLDALVAERLTSSPRIYNVYGLCGIATYSELMAHGDVYEVAFGRKKISNTNHTGSSVYWPSTNGLTGIQKLEIVLNMAEALADLHGASSGVIVHQDTKREFHNVVCSLAGETSLRWKHEKLTLTKRHVF
jgi:hypothetical protein